MKKKIVQNQAIITSIDIGTTKISVLIGQVLADSTIDIIGIGKAPSYGLARGVVVDIAKTVHSIKTAAKEATLMAGIDIESCYIGISGGHIQAHNSHGIVPIKQGKISEQDIANVIASAQAIPLAEGQQILHVLPQYYIIDGQEIVTNPIGMHGIRLEAHVHIITGAVSSVQNLITCCQAAGVKVKDIVLEHLASAHAVLSDDERELGVGVLDIGGGTSDFALYHNGNIRHTKVIPIAGNYFTNDCAIGLRTSKKEAEDIKIAYGCAYDQYSLESSSCTVYQEHELQPRMIQISELIAIIQPRAEELLGFLQQEITQYKLRTFMYKGLVITGGGSLLKGFTQLAEVMLQMPVRQGIPHIEGSFTKTLANPLYATGYGLLLYGIKKSDTASGHTMDGQLLVRVMSRMRSWISDFF
jgi:cell division protein FtsA